MSSSLITQPPTYASGLFWELQDGFFLSSTPEIDLFNQEFRSDPNPWIRLVALLEAAKRGDFRECYRASDIVYGCQDPSLWNAWSVFVGHVCPVPVVRRAIGELMEQYPDGVPDFVYDHASSAIIATQQLSLLPLVVDWYVRRKETELGELLAFRLGQLLESERSEFSVGKLSGEMLVQVIQDIHHRLSSEIRIEQMSVRAGELFTPELTAKRMLSKLRSSEGDPEEEFIDDRMIFEATTGIDLSPCFKDETLQQLVAADLLENTLLHGNLSRFRAGGRYFFGHLIPLI